MSQELQKWTRQSYELLERIRNRFNDYFQVQKINRSSFEEQDDRSAKVQNQWRKLNELISKEIPERQKCLEVETSKKLDTLKYQALRILSMFKKKFGEEKHNEFKLLQSTQSWKNPIFNSGLRNYQSQGKSKLKTTKYEPILDDSESNAKSSIIIEQPEEQQQIIIKKLEESERRSYSRLYKEKKQQRWAKICGFVLVFILVMVLLMPYITIPMPTSFFKYLFQNDL